MSDWVSVLVAIATLSLAVAVFVQMWVSRKALAREIHAEHLRDFLKEWRAALHLAYVERHTIFRQRYTPSDGVESNPLFNDLKEHLHKESGLMESHARYKGLWRKFKETGHSLYAKILTDSRTKTGLELTAGNKTGLRQGYITTLNEQYLTFASEEKVGFEEFVVHTTRDQASTTGGWIVHFGGTEIAVVEDESKANDVIDTHRRMLRDYTNSRYNDLAATLVKTSPKINGEVETLYREIDELIAQPLFAGDCKYLKRSMAGKSRWRKLFENRNRR